MRVQINNINVDYKLLAEIRRAKMIEEGDVEKVNNINWELYAKVLAAKAEKQKFE